MKILRAEGFATLPWKNGRGLTREIAVYRDPAEHDDFLWRLSLASVTESCPFSHFPGVDRTIAVLDGPGMVLHMPGQDVSLAVTSDPFIFAGETPVDCELPAGPTVDLNVMTRRGYFRHTLKKISFTGRASLTLANDKTLLVSNGHLKISSERQHVLAPFDAVVDLEPEAMLELWADAEATVFAVELTPGVTG
ncbi:MAG: HutD family protein [Devosia sp.]|nr:HutD family protein [Devosia sp.]